MSSQGRVAGAAGWTVASRVADQGSQFLLFLVAARFLSPTEFGVFSLLSACFILMSRLVQGGWAEFLTSWRGDPEADAHAFWLSVVGGVGVCAVGVLAAGVMTQIPAVADYAVVQLILSLAVPGCGVLAAWSGMLMRKQRADVMAKGILFAQVVGAAAAAAGLWVGWGMVALATGKLVTHVAQLGAFGLGLRWFPRWRMASSGLGEIKQFTTSLLTTNLIGYAQGYAATLLLGFFLGPASVGLYRAGLRLAASASEVIREPARIVCWMTLRKAADDDDASQSSGGRALVASSERFLTLVLAFATPLFLGLAVTSESVIVALLGETWVGAAPVVSILAVGRLITLPTVIMPPLLSMANHVQRIARLQLVTGMATLVAVPLCAPFGIVPTAWGQLGAAVVSAAVTASACARYGSVRFSRAVVMSSSSAIASLIMVAVVLVYRPELHHLVMDGRLHVVPEVGAGMAVFLLLFTLLGGWRRLGRLYALTS